MKHRMTPELRQTFRSEEFSKASDLGRLRLMGLEPIGFWFRKPLTEHFPSYVLPLPKMRKAAEAFAKTAKDPRLLLAVLGAAAEGVLWPGDHVDLEWSADERARVLKHLRTGGERFMLFLGYSHCRLCDKDDNGSGEMTDGVYVWPDGYAHYIEEHGVKPSQAFIDHVLRGGKKGRSK